MPDEQVPQTVAVDEGKLSAMINQGIKQSLTEMQQQTQAQVQQYTQQREAAQKQQSLNAQWASDPVAQTIAPYVTPIAQQLTLQVQAANDKADFYLSHPEAMEYKGDVESMFNTLMTQGRPMEREAVWYYYKGRNEDAFREKAEQQKAEALQTAAQRGASVGQAAMPASVQTLENFRDLSPEKQKDALKGMSF